MSFFPDMTALSGYASDKAEEISQLLAQHTYQNEQIIQHLQASLEVEQFVRRSAAGFVAADGTCELAVVSRPGFILKLHGLATSQVTAGNGFVAFYFDSSSDGQNLCYAGSGAILLSDTFPEGTTLQENSTLIARFTGLTAGDRVTAAVTASRLPTHVPISVPGVPY